MQMFSDEWVRTLGERLKSDAEFQKKGEGFDSHFHFRVLKDPSGGLSKDVEFGMWFPTCEPLWLGPKPDGELDIILEAKAGVYSQVFKGKKNVVMALTMGAIKIKKGSLSKLTGNLGTVNRFIEVAGAVG